MINEILKKAFDQKALIGVTTKEIEWEQSSMGFILEINNDSFILDEIDEFGMYEGKTIIEIKEIIYITVDSCYLRKLQQIFENSSIFDLNKGVRVWKEGITVMPYIKELKENQKIARFYFDVDHNSETNFVTGIIVDFDDHYFLLKSIEDDGSIEGYFCYRIQDIIRLRYDDLSEQKVDFLLHNQIPPFQ